MQLKFDAKQPLNLKISLTMGQAFRWKETSDGWFSGVVQDQFIRVRQPSPGVLEFRGQPGPDDEIATSSKPTCGWTREIRLPPSTPTSASGTGKLRH